MSESLNPRHPGVRRVMQELRELQKTPSADYTAAPLENNLFEWHFTIRGPPDSDFTHGIYHGKIFLPPEYPFKPPDFLLLTPNGRFEVGKKICLSISGYHPETWQPSWSIRVALLAIRAFFPTPGEGAIGAVDYPSDVRQRLAKKSLSWQCTECGITCATALPIIEQASDVDDKLKEQVAQMQIGVRAPPVDGKAEEKKEEDGKTNDSKENDSKDLQEEKSPSIQTTKAKSETEKSTKDTSNFTNAQRLENMNRNPQNQSSENILSFLSLFLLIGILAILVKKLFASSQME